MKIEEYYIAPPQEIFEDIKEHAIKIWQSYDDSAGYATNKISRIKDITNVQDNAWYIVAMFDWVNQHKLLSMVSDETAKMIQSAISSK